MDIKKIGIIGAGTMATALRRLLQSAATT